MTDEPEKKMIEEPKWHHRGYDISLEPRNGRFRVEGDDISEPHCDSLAEATGKIDAYHSAAAKAKKVKVALSVYEPNGKEATITGIHAGHGTLTGVKGGGMFDNYVYPRVPWVIDAIKKIDELEEQRSALRYKLEAVRIRTKRQRGYGNKLNPDDIPGLVRQLITEHEAMTKKAEQMSVEA